MFLLCTDLRDNTFASVFRLLLTIYTIYQKHPYTGVRRKRFSANME